MAMEVRFRMMQCSAFPSGTGGNNFEVSTEIIVQNLGYTKNVSLWDGKDGKPLENMDAHYDKSLPENLERWTIKGKPDADQSFVAKYEVNGKTYWDNNNCKNYKSIDYSPGELNVITGLDFPVIHGQSELTSSALTVYAGIQNLGDEKKVGLIFTTDNWKTYDRIHADYLWTMKSGLEVWKFNKKLSNVSKVDFSLFYIANRCEYWDNNFSQNYTITKVQQTAELKKTKRDLISNWEKPSTRKIPQKSAATFESEQNVKLKEPLLEQATI